MNKDILIPILITVGAGLCTGIGSVAALFIREFKHKYLSIMLGFSAGVMVYVSFVDLLFKSIREIGLVWANVWFFLGILLIVAVERFIPHVYLEEKQTAFPVETVPADVRVHHHHGGSVIAGGGALRSDGS